jgi:mono/diheme cytochrome c family protein
MQHNMRDPARDKKHGRIFRMIHKDRPLQEAVAIDGEPVAALLDVLKHPINGVRERARIELSERDPREVEQSLREWLKPLDPQKPGDSLAMLEGLWLFQRLNIREQPLLAALLESPDVHIRNAAATVKHLWGPADPTSGSMQVVNQEPEEPEEKTVVQVPAHLTGEAAQAYRIGAGVYHREAHCATCHQAHGKGLDPVYPPLAGTAWVTGSEERLIKIVLNGLWGDIQVNDKSYETSKGVPPMTAFKSMLNDAELAAVLTYVRNSWGNKAAPVKPETVRKIRAATQDRSIFWKPEELLKEHPLED